jgi:chemotaxis response regulator CheB
MAHTSLSTVKNTSASHTIIVLGTSAGGIKSLAELVSRLPADLPAAVFVVLHIPAKGFCWKHETGAAKRFSAA